MNTNIVRNELQRGIRDSLPIMIGMLPLALILGIQGAQKGMSILEIPLMTGLNFAGGSEFAAVDLWHDPLPILLIITVTFMINTRHILMGAALAPYIRHYPLKHSLPMLFFMTDETWAMSFADIQRRKSAGLPPFSAGYYMGIGGTLYILWITFTTLGASLGTQLGNIEALSFGMAFPAIFLVLLRGMWKGFSAAIPWLISLITAAIVYRLVDGAWYVPAGAISGLITAYFRSEA